MMYSFRFNHLQGNVGEIPYIMLDAAFDDLPPINQAHKIVVDFLSNQKWQSKLDLFWQTEENITLRILLEANHPKLKKQYKENKQVAEQIIGLLKGPEMHNMVLSINKILNETDIPKDLLPAVRQIPIWEKYIESLDSNYFFQIYGSKISDGWYTLPVESGMIWTPQQGLYSPDFCVSNPLRFDPVTQPPEVHKEYICWKLPDHKVIIVLVHKRVEKRITDYYGYTEQYQSFLNDQKETEQYLEEQRKRSLKYRTQKKDQEDAQLRAKLLS